MNFTLRERDDFTFHFLKKLSLISSLQVLCKDYCKELPTTRGGKADEKKVDHKEVSCSEVDTYKVGINNFCRGDQAKLPSRIKAN